MVFCSITRKEIVKTECVGKRKWGTPEGCVGWSKRFDRRCIEV